MSDLLEKIGVFEARASELEAKLADPGLGKDRKAFAALGRELAALRPVVETGEKFRSAHAGLADAKAMLDDPDSEVQELARGEAAELSAQLEALDQELRLLLVPGDPNDAKNVILEIRAGTGGDEAALFAGDLFRMYSRYAEKQGWKVESLSLSDSASGGMKEGIFMVAGSRVFSRLKHERGVHRVQRVPATESQGRIHTSTATVAVLPEAEEVDLEIEAKDLRIDVYRASGPGGQSVNTTDSAVRVTHEPSGLVVQCQDEKSQHKNKAKALKILRSRLFDHVQQKLADERADARRGQVGGGERAEKIRTYNFPQSRITDHRAAVTLHRLDDVMEGELDELLDAVQLHMAAEAEQAALGS
ncbi:MAG: peptide chain release factor 1 [Deltaproteobacteria bacterium]|nr:peptide chain release factor 1 [Deltaproteobacteria bacterium]MBW2361807.1 peptide chain release factor 1 [Deltaproteobacteria bacterium]